MKQSRIMPGPASVWTRNPWRLAKLNMTIPVSIFAKVLTDTDQTKLESTFSLSVSTNLLYVFIWINVTSLLEHNDAQPRVKFLRMSPKLVPTYPHIVENWGIKKAPLFLRLILWKSIPQSIQNSHFCHCQNQNGTSFLVQSADALSSLQCRQKQTNQPKHQWKSQVWQRFLLIGEDFFMHDINLKNNGAIVIPWFSTTCG